MGFFRTLKTETSAVVNINAENEISFSLSDAQGRSLMSGILHPHDAVSPNTPGALLTWSCQVPDITETINSKIYLTSLSVDALGNTTKSRSNGLGQTVQSVDQAGNISSVQYDAGGNAIVSRDPNNVGQDCVYDALGRRTQCTDTVGSVTKTGYDKSGQQITATDAKNKVTHYVYDARGRRRKETDRLTYPTEWEYDAAGNLLSLKDAENQITSYTYNDAGQRITEQYPDHVAGATIGQAGYGKQLRPPTDEGGKQAEGGSETQLDALGRRTSKQETTGAADREGRIKADGVSTTGVTSYNFDKQPSPPTDEGGCRARAVVAKELLTRGYVGHASGPLAGQTNTDTFTYDRAGRMLSGVKGRYSNTITFAYDDRGQQTQETLTTHGQTYTVGYVKNVLGQTTRLVYPDGSLVDRAYTNRGQLQSVNYTPNGGTASSVATFTYDAGGRETQRNLGNGLTTTRSYLADNQIQSIATPTVETLTYTYDANKNPTSETRSGVMAPYSWSTGTSGYDDEDRLVNWSRTNGDSQSWNLSPVHDWNTTTINGAVQTRTHGPAHELLTMSGAQVTNSPRTLTYDTKGNMTTDDRGCGMTWDFDNMLQSFAANGVTDLKNATYEYDAIGRKIRQIEGNGNNVTIVVCLYDGYGELECREYGVSNKTIKLVKAAYIDDVITSISQSGSVENLAWSHMNRQYTSYATTDNSGQTTARIHYSTSGEPTDILHGNLNSYDSRYAGRMLDKSSSLYGFRTRTYAATIGQFLSRDKAGYIDGSNLFNAYFSAKGTDPLGLWYDGTTDHHWFMKYWKNRGKGQAIFDGHCPQLAGTDIDLFTTTYDTACHREIHEDIEYQELYESIDATARDCCEFLTKVLILAFAVHEISNQMNNTTDPFWVHPYEETGPDTLLLWRKMMIDVCGQKKFDALLKTINEKVKEKAKEISEEIAFDLKLQLSVLVGEMVVLTIFETILVADDATGVGAVDDVLIVPTAARQACTAKRIQKTCSIINQGVKVPPRMTVPPTLAF